MSCEQWFERIIDQASGELGEDDGVELAQHLAECALCEREARAVGALLDASSAAPEWRESPGLRAELVRRLRAQAGPSSVELPASPGPGLLARILGSSRRPVPAYAAAALVAIAVLGGFWAGRERAAPWPDRGATGAAKNSRRVEQPLAPAPRTGFEATPADVVLMANEIRPDSL